MKKKGAIDKGTNEWDELGQLTTYHTKLREYNLVNNGVEGVYNIYLQHHSLKVKIQDCLNTTTSHLP